MSESMSQNKPILLLSGAGYQLTVDTAVHPLKELNLHSFSNKGELKSVMASGFSLSAILRQENVDLTLLAGIGFVASDGYIMVVPQEICLSKEIYICFSKNERQLLAPMVAVDLARSMYWSYNLTAIQLYPLAALPDAETKNTISYPQAEKDLARQTLDVGGEHIEACALKDIIGQLQLQVSDLVLLSAKDGHQKWEPATVFSRAYLGYSEKKGYYYFFIEDLAGMTMQQLDWIRVGDTILTFDDQYVCETIK